MAAVLTHDAIETIPGLLVVEHAPRLPHPTAERAQILNLIASNGHLIAKAEAAEARAASLADKLHENQLLVAYLSEQVRTLKGENATPDRGCSITEIRVGDARLLVEYELEEGEPADDDVESPTAGPGADAVVRPLRVFVGGHWTDIGDVRGALDDERLAEEIGGGL